MTTRITVVNLESGVAQVDLARIVSAIGVQLSRDFCPAWGRAPVEVRAVEVRAADAMHYVGGAEPSATVFMVPRQETDGFLGFHDVGMYGRPYGVVDVGRTLRAPGASLELGPVSVSAVLSHEILELLVDPGCRTWCDGPPDDKVREREFALEVCDAVQDTTYQIGTNDAVDPDAAHVHVSNFVLPSFFGLGADPETTRYDWLNVLRGPFTVAPGGYSIVRSAGHTSTIGSPGDWRPRRRAGRRVL